MRGLLRENNLDLLRQVHRLQEDLDCIAESVLPELAPYYQWATDAVEFCALQARQNLRDLELARDEILSDILSNTQVATLARTIGAGEVVFATSQTDVPRRGRRMVQDLRRAMAPKRVCVRVFRRRHLEKLCADARPHPFFVGNPRSRLFHRTSCPYRDRIRWPEQPLDSIEDAGEAGYRPCKACQPQKPADAADKPSPTR